MRKIKFRAWNKETKVMVDLNKITPLALSIEPALVGARTGVYVPDDDRLDVMQFTGLLDKNGKEIYEGDIVKQHYVHPNANYISEEGDLIGKVKILPSLGVCIASPYFHMDSDNNRTIVKSYHHIRGYRSEVISNIYENPKLLKR